MATDMVSQKPMSQYTGPGLVMRKRTETGDSLIPAVNSRCNLAREDTKRRLGDLRYPAQCPLQATYGHLDREEVKGALSGHWENEARLKLGENCSH